MQESDFYDLLQVHFDDVLPFVVYRKSKETTVTAFLQQDETLHQVNDFSESGFVFAPYDNTSVKTVIIPTTFSDRLSVTISNSSSSKTCGLKALDVKSIKDRREKHILLVKKGISQIKEGRLKKVVLSRKQTIPTNNTSPITIFKRLLKEYTTAFVYCWYHPKVGLWLGATPETLLSIKNRQLKTMSLAGTQKTQGSGEVVWGQKEIDEQQLVTDSIVENLQSLIDNLKVSEVENHQAGSLLHLKTDISATLDTTKINVKDIISALHPTPAVCGLPKSAAKKFIRENESYNRSYYTGFLGELNLTNERSRTNNRRNVENLAYRSLTKNTELFVNLRCMEIDAQCAQLFVGGGITSASNPQAEWEETVNKLQTMVRVL